MPGGRFWIYEMDPDAPAEAIRRDRGMVWGLLRMPVRMQRAMARDHGFSAAEAETLVRPVVEKSGFGALRVHRTGSTLRMELTNVASGDLTP